MIITSVLETARDDEHATVRAGELVVVLPNELAPEGPLVPALQTIILAVAEAGYWPLDFGEGDDTHTTLHFVKGESARVCDKQAKHFIKQNGDV